MQSDLRQIHNALLWAVEQLRPSTDAPRLEAEVLLAHALARPRTYLLAHPEAALSPEQAGRYAAWIMRRAAAEPLPYITGQAEFYGLNFTVTPAVLIPRPETELLVERALHHLRTLEAPTFVDVGTGSGCIAVTLLTQLPTARGFAVDISPAALAVARANAERHGVAKRLTLLEGDLLAPLAVPVALIASNPPYIAEREWDALPPSVQCEPRGALLAGPDGLDALRGLLWQAPERLQAGGRILVEIGAEQGHAAQALAQAAFAEAEIHIRQDLAGKDRLLEIIPRT